MNEKISDKFNRIEEVWLLGWKTALENKLDLPEIVADNLLEAFQARFETEAVLLIEGEKE